MPSAQAIWDTPASAETDSTAFISPITSPSATRPPTATAVPQTATATLSLGPTLVEIPTEEIPPAVQTAVAVAALLPRAATANSVPIYTYKIVNVYPHDPAAFTQGLVFEEGFLFEGTGFRGESTLRKVDLETGNSLMVHSLPGEYFGEGITIWGDRIIQLTWTSRLGFVYDKSSFDEIDTFGYATEGWGITHDSTRLIVSDGTATLHFWDPSTFEKVGQVVVHDEQGPITWLNELEYVRGLIYANVWQTDAIVIVNPEDGQVTGWIDLTGLLGPEDRDPPVDVLNGIAYDEREDRLFVTGKLWPKLFEIDLVRRIRLYLPIVVGRETETP